MRELKNAIEHAVILASGDELRAEDLPRTIAGGNSAPVPARAGSPPTWREWRERTLAPLERRFLEQLLERTRGNISLAAEQAGVDRVTLYKMLRKHNIVLESLYRRGRNPE